MVTALAGLVSKFVDKYQLKELAEDENGVVTLYIDEHPVRVFESLNKVYLETQIKLIPSESYHRVEFLKAALRASLTNASDYQVSLYLDKESEALCMYQRVDADGMDLGTFEHLLERFMYAVDGFSSCTNTQRNSDRPRLIVV
ncbi:MAG: CesT family type III secretion system chaperone [Reinekea sp.]|jgi:hypothetical protein